MGNLLSNEEKSKTRVPKHLLPSKQRTSSKNKKPDTTQSDTIPRIKDEDLVCQKSSKVRFTWSHHQKPFNIKSADYYLPNDQPEQDRHKVELYVLRWAFSTRHIVPTPLRARLFEGIEVLNVNCGPGLWDGHPILDMAQDFVQSKFTLADTCNLLPQSSSFDDERIESIEEKYKNFTFKPHNIQQDKTLPFAENTFDLIIEWIMMFVYKKNEWPEVLAEFKRISKPGGYVQLLEVEFPPQNMGPESQRWMEQIRKVLEEKLGIDATVGTQTKRLLSDAGFRDIQTRFVSIPIGSWGLDIGNLWKQNYESFFDSAEPFMLELMGLTVQDYKRNVKIMMDELDEYKPFSNVYHTWGCVPK
ncbi:hypothetical protein G6F56_010599 [Rhizopus delemar]|nr:hypothetical protein G6F56_010599 [Rhizopus delemar]